MKKDKITKIAIGISMDTEIIERIDNLRGDVTRSRFTSRLLEMMFDNHKDEIEEYVNQHRMFSA